MKIIKLKALLMLLVFMSCSPQSQEKSKTKPHTPNKENLVFGKIQYKTIAGIICAFEDNVEFIDNEHFIIKYGSEKHIKNEAYELSGLRYVLTKRFTSKPDTFHQELTDQVQKLESISDTYSFGDSTYVEGNYFADLDTDGIKEQIVYYKPVKSLKSTKYAFGIAILKAENNFKHIIFKQNNTEGRGFMGNKIESIFLLKSLQNLHHSLVLKLSDEMGYKDYSIISYDRGQPFFINQ